VRSSLLILWITGLLVAPAGAQAQPEPLERNLAVDLSLVGGLGAGWLVSELAKERLAPSECRWCEPPGIDTWARDGLRWSQPDRAARTSDILVYGVLPLGTLGLDALLAARHGDGDTVLTDSLIILESVVVSATITQVTKMSVGRERPFVHALSPDQKSQTDHPADNNLSFFSGHTSLAFALAVGAGTTATLRDYPERWVIWAVGLTGAVAAGWLRMAGDRHYFTDVLTGALIGSAAGILVPLAHRPRAGSTQSGVTAGLAGPVVMVSMTF
jgi:membrane-associated phospholipid phosphatase